MLLPKAKALQKRLHEGFSQIEIKKSHGYELGWEDWEALGRCYYYLRDERATEYLQQAALLVAQQRVSTINPRSSSSLFKHAGDWFYAANLYRLTGDKASMRACIVKIRELEESPVWIEWSVYVEFYWDLLALAALMEGDAAQALIYDAKIAALPERENPDRPWSGRLAEAIVHADTPAIRAIGSELHGLLIRYHGKPWDTTYLNLWDWYEFTDTLADQLETQQSF
ncbi:hypothetical protein [Herpetosiphon giganteus]|uniref:hypothetical protein n=1 Tax=Herpetosiphon giganteus TaxID=2029754 RepID=UPI0019574362|nr:hypothetical protein [Herpetosiphon giganteus]MBM7841680.1 hypothetical protein [Herpetosiphon giganteus]